MNPIGAIFWKDLKSLVRNKSIYTVSLVVLAVACAVEAVVFVFLTLLPKVSGVGFPHGDPVWFSAVSVPALGFVITEFIGLLSFIMKNDRIVNFVTVFIFVLAFVFALNRTPFPSSPFWISALAGSAISVLVYFVAEEFEECKNY